MMKPDMQIPFKHNLQTTTSLCLEYMKFWLYPVVFEYLYK